MDYSGLGIGDILDDKPLLAGISTEKVQLLVVERTNEEVSSVEALYFGVLLGTIDINDKGVLTWNEQFSR